VIAAGGAVLASGSLGDRAAGPCGGHPVRGGIRLPDPVTIEAPVFTRAGRFHGYVAYRIGCYGSVRRIGRVGSLFPQDAAYGGLDPGVWWALRHGHLVIGQGRRSVWRSHGEFRARYGVGAVELGARTVAFSYGSNLYLAPLRGAERMVGRAEFALGFTRGGVYTISWTHGLLLRSDSGTIRKMFVHWTTDYFAARGRLYFIAHGVLMRASGARVRPLVSLAKLRMSRDTGLQPLSADRWSQAPGGLFELEDNDRLTVLRSDGEVFATVSSGGTFTPPVVAPGERAVAFVVSTPQGTETDVLRAGARTATLVHFERVHFPACSGGATVQWYGSWLLYSDSAGGLVAIDTTGARWVVDLTRLVKRLPSVRNGFTADWGTQGPEL